MSKPRSPFDDTDDDPPVEVEAPSRWSLPARKWSFIALAVVLFALTWIREWTQIPAPATLAIVAVILACWLTIHLVLYTSSGGAMARAFRRTGDEVAPIFRPHYGILRFSLGVIVGIWLWDYVFRELILWRYMIRIPILLSPSVVSFAVLVTALVLRSVFIAVRPPVTVDSRNDDPE